MFINSSTARDCRVAAKQFIAMYIVTMKKNKSFANAEKWRE